MYKEIQRYPLTDIAYDENRNLFIEIAVAGFDKSDIEIEVRGNKLHIQGVYNDDDDIVGLTYTQKNISQKDFERIIVLNDIYVGGTINASMENGLLSIIMSPAEVQKTVVKIN